ncbi:MAG: response regulator [Chloroflexi bacterium]|nr:response regulator [Chloroflexota bacterium]
MIKPYALIIDGNHENAKYLANLLESSGFQTQLAGSGHEARARLSFTNPDLILLDATLPFLPAAVILRQIHGQPRLARARVLLLADDPATAAALMGQADGILPRRAEAAQLSLHLRLLHLDQAEV